VDRRRDHRLTDRAVHRMVESMHRPAWRKRALGELALVAGGKVFGLVALLAGNVLVARAVGQSEYGIYAAAQTLVLLLDAIIGSPLDLAVVRFGALHAGEEQRVDRLWSAAMRIKLAIIAALFVVAALFRAHIAALFFQDAALGGVLLTAIGCASCLLLMRGTAAFVQSRTRFRAYALLDGAQGVLRLALLCILLASGVRSAGALLATFGVGTALVFVIAAWKIPQRYMRSRWPERDDARAILAYVGTTAFLIVLGTITGRSDVLILSAMRSSAESGTYAAAVQLAMIPTMLASYASVVAQPKVVGAARTGRLLSSVGWNALGATCLCVLAAPLIAWFLPELVRAIFGPEFSGAAPILRVLLIGTCADLFLMPVIMVFGMQLFPRAALAGEIVITAAFAIAAVVAARAGAIELAWTMTGVRVAKLVWYGWIVWRHAGGLRSAPAELANVRADGS
jgi:O-antigen/teichoic acid export membrane protein